jgi:hypothetical protein
MLVIQQYAMSLDLKNHPDKDISKMANKYYNFKEEMSKRKTPVEFNYIKTQTYHKDFSGKLIADSLSPIRIPMKDSIDVDGINQTWAYSERIAANPSLLTSSSEHEPDGMIVTQKKLTFDPKKDIDKIFYLRYISQFFADDSKGRKYFAYYDAEEESKKLRQVEIDKVEFNNIIYSELYFSEREIEVAANVAKSLGVHGVEDMGFHTIMEAIKANVLAKEKDKENTRYGINEFINEIKDGSSLELRALVYKAKEEGYIHFFPASNSWSFVDSSGSELSRIMRVAPVDVRRAEDALFKHMKDDDKLIKDLKGMMGYKEKPVSAEDKLEELSKDWSKLKAFATEKGIQATKKNDIIKEILEKIGRNEITIDMFD